MSKKKPKKTTVHRTATNNGILPGRWFALLNHPADLPVLFASRRDAVESRDYDEYLVEVFVHASRLGDVTRARLWEAQQKAAKLLRTARPRVPDEEKRRRGLTGDGMLRSALRRAVPAMQRKVASAIKRQAKALVRPAKKKKSRRR